MKLKPHTEDFKPFPEIDFTGRLDKAVSYDNSYEELLQGMKKTEVRRQMQDAIVSEIFNRAYNYTALMFAGYNRLAYICMMYAEEVKKEFLKQADAPEWNKSYLIGLMMCAMDGRGKGELKEPFLIIGADNEKEAEEVYNGYVPLTSYYSCYVIARQESGSTWQSNDYNISQEVLDNILQGELVRKIR